MSWRVVIVSSRAKLELKLNYLVIRGEETRRVHIDEIDVLMIENTGCTVTLSLLETLWEHKVDVIFCDHKHNPGSQLIPFYNSFDNSARVAAQVGWNEEICGSVWAAIVTEKIINQSRCLFCLGRPGDDRVLSYAEHVVTGDVENREGMAAKVYFNALFDSDFSRSEPCHINSALDYGYTVLLSAVNREVVANGYLTQLGICHRNQFNQFNLSCDLVEPFRPLIDQKVYQLPKTEGPLGKNEKYELVNVLNSKVVVRGRKETVLNTISIYVRSVLEALDTGDVSRIIFYDYEL